MMKSCSFKTLIIVAMVALLVLPIAACAPKAPPPPPAGTLTVEPAKIDQALLQGNLMRIMILPVKFKGTGWQPNEIVTVDLVVPPDVEMKGLDRARGEDSVGIAYAAANDKGDFEVTLETVAKVSWLLRGSYLPTLTLDTKSLGNPLPNGTYTLRAVGEDTRSVATTTWDLQLVAPPVKK